MSNEFVMVPREPTAEMLAAAKKSGVTDPRVSGYCYALMVAAAPTHQGELTDEQILKMAEKAFGQAVDYDLRGNPVTDYHVLLMGAYAPAIRRIVRLARQHPDADPGEVTLNQVLQACEYAESHPHKYLRGTTNWCAAVAWHLNKNRSA